MTVSHRQTGRDCDRVPARSAGPRITARIHSGARPHFRAPATTWREGVKKLFRPCVLLPPRREVTGPLARGAKSNLSTCRAAFVSNQTVGAILASHRAGNWELRALRLRSDRL